VNQLHAWLDQRTAKAPPELRRRVLEHAFAITVGAEPSEHLAIAAQRVLSIVEEHPGDRSIALDLLAADALITLALLSVAETAPQELGAFATGLLAAERVG
jgi:hypothetical protein